MNNSDGIKILMVTESFRIGGKERRLLELLKGFIDMPVQCEIILLKDLIQYAEVKSLPFRLHIFTRKVKKDFRVFGKILNVIDEFRPDIVHAWGGMAAIYSIPIARLKGIKTVNAMITNSSPVNLFRENWIRSRLTFPFSNIILSNSRAGISAYTAKLKKSKVIYNGFALSRIKNLVPENEVRARFSIKTSKVVGMVGAMYDRKDYSTYIKAAIEICLKRSDITFIVVGDGPNFERCVEMVPANLNERILFLGNQNDVESLVNIFTIGVLTTNQKVHGEGISNSILEYMALGKPVIATKGGGTGEIVEDGNNGFLVPEFSVNDLVEKIDVLLNNNELAVKYGANGKNIVKERFSVEQMVQNTFKLYKQCIIEKRNKNL